MTDNNSNDTSDNTTFRGQFSTRLNFHVDNPSNTIKRITELSTMINTPRQIGNFITKFENLIQECFPLYKEKHSSYNTMIDISLVLNKYTRAIKPTPPEPDVIVNPREGDNNATIYDSNDSNDMYIIDSEGMDVNETVNYYESNGDMCFKCKRTLKSQEYCQFKKCMHKIHHNCISSNPLIAMDMEKNDVCPMCSEELGNDYLPLILESSKQIGLANNRNLEAKHDGIVVHVQDKHKDDKCTKTKLQPKRLEAKTNEDPAGKSRTSANKRKRSNKVTKNSSKKKKS